MPEPRWVGMLPRSMCQCWRRNPDGRLVLKWPSLSEDAHDDADPGSALMAAVERPGGQVQALRHLKAVMDCGVDPLKFISSEQLSRTLRTGRRFDDFVRMARPDFSQSSWSTGIVEESGLWFAYQIDHSTQSLQVVLVQDIQEIDPVRAAAGYCATDLFSKHSSDVQACTALAQAPDSALWNQVREFTDDIVQVDFVNALDEPLGAIMLMIHPQPEGSPDFPFACIPGPCRPARSRGSRQCVTFTPLPGGSVRMHVAAWSSLGDEKTLSEIERASKEGLAKLMRPLVTIWPMRFEAFLRAHREELIHWEAFSPQAPFYAVCRGYLAGQAGSRRRLGACGLLARDAKDTRSADKGQRK